MDFTALGKKLCFSLFAWVLMFLYGVPQRRGTNNLFPGWVGGWVGSAAIP